MPERSFLVIQSGPRAGERVSIAGDRFTIGRKAGNSLVLTDASVSGSHCELRRQGERWHLKDLGSTNGTFHGGAKVLEVMVGPGDQFAIGSVLLRLEGDTDEIVLDDGGPETAVKPAAASPAAPVKPASVKPDSVKLPPAAFASAAFPPPAAAAHGTPSTRTGELDFVEDEPLPPNRTQMVSAAVASARSVRGLDGSVPDPTIVSDAGLVQRARHAAEAAARKNRVATLVVGAAAVVALGVGAYFTFFSSSSPAARHKPVANVPGNLLPLHLAAFELEGEDAPRNSPQWQLRDASLDDVDGTAESDEEDGKAAVKGKDLDNLAFYGFGYSIKRNRTGQRALEAKLESRGIARATTDPVSVNSGQRLRFAIHAAAGAEAGAIVQVVFRSKSSPTRRIVRTGAGVAIGEGTREYTRLEGNATVPQGCDQACLSLVAFGANDSVAFDDAELVPLTEPGPPAVTRKDLDFEMDAADGRVHKIGRDLIQRMGLAVAAAGSPRARRSLLSTSTTAGQWSFLSTDGDVAKVGLTVEADDTRVTVKYQVAPSPEIAKAGKRILLTWSVDRAFAPEILARGQGGTMRHRADFQQAACAALVVGQERERLRVSFAPPIQIRGVVDGATTRLEMEAPADLTVAFQFSFEAEKRRAFELEQQADAADRDGRIGEAIALRAQIIEEFPFEAALVERNQQKREARILEGQKIVARLERGIADADLFRIPDAFRLAKKMAEELTRQYQGTDVAERAKAVIDAVDRTLADVEAERGEREASRLTTIASALAASNATMLSVYIRDYVKKYFGSTKAAGSLGGN